jgi:hypothetical protein
MVGLMVAPPEWAQVSFDWRYLLYPFIAVGFFVLASWVIIEIIARVVKWRKS